MNSFRSLLSVAALIALLPSLASADVVGLSATPNPVKQGTQLRITARVDRAGTVYFFFKGRPFGSAKQATGPGVVSTTDIVPSNTVPAGSYAIAKDYSAQQNGHRFSSVVTVTR